MNKSLQAQKNIPPPLFVLSGEERFKEHRGFGNSSISFKVASPDSSAIFICENTFQEKGGPARHLRFSKEEWLLVYHGEFRFEIGHETFQLAAGDTLLAPRNMPHVWAFTGDTQGNILITVMSAEKMEAFFREATKGSAMPPQDPELWLAQEMELFGPPLAY